MAKGVEDTAFYRYNRLVSLNDVGGDPDEFGFAPRALPPRERRIARGAGRTRCSPPRPTTTSAPRTCARASTCSRRCRGAGGCGCAAGSRMNARAARARWTARRAARNDEYLLYQTLLGSLARLRKRHTAAQLADYRERIVAYMLKAAARGEGAHELGERERRLRGGDRGVRARAPRRRGRQRVPRATCAPPSSRSPGFGMLNSLVDGRCSSSPRPACPTSTRATSSGTSRWSIPTTAGRWTTNCAARCSTGSKSLGEPTAARLARAARQPRRRAREALPDLAAAAAAQGARGALPPRRLHRDSHQRRRARATWSPSRAAMAARP